MNKAIIVGILMVAFLLVFVGRAISSSPQWYEKRLYTGDDSEIVGYGQADTIEEAKINAKNDIAKQIYSQIVSKNEFTTRVLNEKVTKKGETIIKETTDVRISDAQVIKSEYNQGLWYVALSYEYLTPAMKFVKKIKADSCMNDKQNRYLKKTPLVRAINNEAGCTPSLSIERLNSVWNIAYKGTLQPIRQDFEKLLARVQSSGMIELYASEENPIEGQVISFTVVSRRIGYVSLFNVYENGEAFVIAANQVVEAQMPVVIPDPKSGNELIAGLLIAGKPSIDLFVAVYSETRLDCSKIQHLGKTIEKEEEHYKFSDLLDMMGSYEFSTILIRTTPKVR